MEDRHVCRLAVYSTGRALATYERDHWHVGPTRQRAVGVSSLPCGPLTAWSAHNRHAVTNHLMHGCTHYRREAIRQRSKTRPGRPAIMRGSTGCPRQQKSGLCAPRKQAREAEKRAKLQKAEPTRRIRGPKYSAHSSPRPTG
eukprot:scaffold111635_cov36-Tisochrysis_lutea.AAC.2